MKKLLFTLVIWIAFGPMISLAAATDTDTDSAQDYLKNKINSVIDVLNEKRLKETEKKEKIETIVTSLFDFPLMAKLTLGQKYWPGLTEDEKQKFTNLFIERLKASYLDKMMLYSGEDIIFAPAVQQKNRVHIPTTLTTNEQTIAMTYKLYKSKSNWMLYDMEIQGVSLIKSYNSQFSEILETGTTQDLLKKMESQ